MIIEPPDNKRSPNPNAEENDQLRLNPGAPARKPRSAGKFWFWSITITVVVAGGLLAYSFISSFLYQVRHPHSHMYFEGSEDEVKDWSAVVQPMIREEDPFDIVASVWIRDDQGTDGGLWVDEEELPERLIYSDTVFRDVTFKSKHRFVNVPLRIPTSRFKMANISNYDLRASFVLVQQSPSWLDRAQKFISWKTSSLHAPPVRSRNNRGSNLKEDIFDDFGITIPLIQFYNITGQEGSEKTVEALPKTEDEDWDDEKDDLQEEIKEEEAKHRRSDDLLDIYRLDFTGDQKFATRKHPYIVTRTHLGIVRETKLFKRQPYLFAQGQLANKTCKTQTPRWYHCERMFYNHGVFETRVQMASRSNDPVAKKNKREFLYAPFLSTIKRSAGPMDLLRVPVDRKALSEDSTLTSATSDEEYIDITWKLSFRPGSPGSHVFQMFASSSIDFNMTASENELTYAQHTHESTLGIFGYRTDESAHPRRAQVLSLLSLFLRVVCWFLIVHYWYTRTSTAGISRLGTTLVALYLLLEVNESLLTSVLDPKGKGHWISNVPISYIFLLIPPFVMLKAVSRLEFGSSNSEEKKRSWIPSVYLAKPTHLERASERIEARVSRRVKLLLLISLFGVAHLFAGPYTYFLTPRVPPPPPDPHPLHSLSDHVPSIVRHIYSLGLTFELGGTILQFVMNAYSRSYAGKYKLVSFLMFIAEVLLFLDLLPQVVGSSARIGGVLAREALGLMVATADLVQAVRFKNVKTSEADGEEE